MLAALVLAAQNRETRHQGSNENSNALTDLRPIQQHDKWGYADKNGQMIIEPQFSFAHDFSEGLALVWEGGVNLTDPVAKSFVKMGYINQKGRWVIQSRFKYYYYYDFSDGLASFREQSKGWGYIDSTGKVVVRPRFQWAGTFANGTAPVLLDDKCAYIDNIGQVTEHSQSALPRRKGEQGSNGIFVYKPQTPPCP